MEFAAGIVVFFLLGSWADARWGTDPWLRLAGTFVGIVLGTYLLIKKALATTFTDRRDSTDRRGSPGKGS
jgi:F0F1-type ATP synthase assembly protein I